MVITTADEGCTIAIQNVENHIQEVERQLKNKEYYEQLPKDSTQNHQNAINSMKKVLTNKTY